MDRTVTLSAGGNVPIPREFRETDEIQDNDHFRFHRLGKGQYLLEKVARDTRMRAKLVPTESGLLVLSGPPGSPVITTELVKRIEAEAW